VWGEKKKTYFTTFLRKVLTLPGEKMHYTARKVAGGEQLPSIRRLRFHACSLLKEKRFFHLEEKEGRGEAVEKDVP